jgi:hypothetical protein
VITTSHDAHARAVIAGRSREQARGPVLVRIGRRNRIALAALSTARAGAIPDAAPKKLRYATTCPKRAALEFEDDPYAMEYHRPWRGFFVR